MKKKFLRQDTVRFSKLGKTRKKLRKWRSPRGEHSKIRQKRFGYPVSPEVGYKKPKSEAGRINGKIPIVVNSMGDLGKVKSSNIVIIGRRVGARKKIEMIKKAQEMKHEIKGVGKK